MECCATYSREFTVANETIHERVDLLFRHLFGEKSFEDAKKVVDEHEADTADVDPVLESADGVDAKHAVDVPGNDVNKKAGS